MFSLRICFAVLCISFFSQGLSHCVSLSQYKTLTNELETERKRRAELEKHLSERDQKLNAAYTEKNALLISGKLSEQQAETYKGLIERLKKSVNAAKFKLRLAGGRLVMVLPSDILFASGAAIISKSGTLTIEEITRILIESPDCKYQIEGHTDNVPIHTPRFPSNWELAAVRALNVLHTMVAAGMAPERISSASFADTRPLKANDKQEGRAANRRIEIALIPDLSVLPLDSKKE